MLIGLVQKQHWYNQQRSNSLICECCLVGLTEVKMVRFCDVGCQRVRALGFECQSRPFWNVWMVSHVSFTFAPKIAFDPVDRTIWPSGMRWCSLSILPVSETTTCQWVVILTILLLIDVDSVPLGDCLKGIRESIVNEIRMPNVERSPSSAAGYQNGMCSTPLGNWSHAIQMK